MKPTSSPPRRRITRHWDARQLLLARRATVALLIILLLFIFHPVYVYVIEHREFTTCQDNVRKIYRGIETYGDDYDSTLPMGGHWMDGIAPYVAARSGTGKTGADVFQCPLDKSGQSTSYTFNDLLSGLSPNVQMRGATVEAESRRRAAGRLDRVPMLIEKHGGPRNASMTLKSWDDVIANLSKPHNVPLPTGSVLFGNGSVSSKDGDQLDDLRGHRF